MYVQPLLFDILVYVSGGLGFFVHYVIPHLRKEMPWLCCSHPLLRSHERGQFEVKGLRHLFYTVFFINLTNIVNWVTAKITDTKKIDCKSEIFNKINDVLIIDTSK